MGDGPRGLHGHALLQQEPSGSQEEIYSPMKMSKQENLDFKSMKELDPGVVTLGENRTMETWFERKFPG